MAKFAVVSLSQLIENGRWDAGFHIALAEVRERVDFLRSRVGPDEAVRLLAAIPLEDKAPLLVLCRGGTPKLNAANIERAVKEYPHLALAMTEKNVAAAVKRIQE